MAEEVQEKKTTALEALIIFVFAFMIFATLLARFSGFLGQYGISPGKAFAPGLTVMALHDLSVVDDAGNAVGGVLKGALGVVLDGPKTFGSARKWLVDFGNGVKGWVDENDLSLTPDAIKLGSRVRSTIATNVYETPNGSILGTHSAGDTGVVTQGPISIDGVDWWYVDYDTDPDGWVTADSIVPESKQSRLDLIASKGSPFFSGFVAKLSTILLFASFIGIFVIIYSLVRIRELEHLEHEAYADLEHQHIEDHRSNDRFDTIQSLVATQNPSDWRQAIIEADIMLDELLTQFGYFGASVGDKLKQVRTGDLMSVQDAWDAHKVRNDIAHRGSDFILTKREAENTIGRYRRVFEELGLFS